MRILVSGGGTGGHIYPALAIATQLQQRYAADILYLGSDDGLETQLVPAAGFRMATVRAGKLRRYVSLQTIKGVMRVPIGMVQAVKIVREFHPDAAFTSGGYVAVPAALAAKLSGTPLLLHQQDVPPNLSNKLIAPLATRISVAFADSLRYFPARKTLLLGNPIRQEILDIRQRPVADARAALGFDPTVPLLLVTGGSQGARHLNNATVQALPSLLQHCQVLQISGQKLFDETQRQADEITSQLDSMLRPRYRLVPYLSEEMPIALRAAEIVLCRAGAATLSELALLEKPSILVPLPPGIGSSPQEVNAQTFAGVRAADVVRNDDLTPEVIQERVLALLQTPGRLEQMGQALRTFARPTSTQDIAAAVATLARGSSSDSVEKQDVQV